MAPTTAFIFDPKFRNHAVGPGHPERPARLDAVLTGLRQTGVLAELAEYAPTAAPTAWLQSIHQPAYIADVEVQCRTGTLTLDADTHISGASYRVACHAVGAGLTAADLIMAGHVRNAFCAVRPPGHHAEATYAKGFCLFNNIAVTARYLQRHHNLKRIFIVDFDVHHGNGTQHSFDEDPGVYYFSIHQYPFYPGTGAAYERGQGAGRGATLNVPLPAGKGDDVYLRSFEAMLVPAAESFKPQCLLISAGFDAHEDDPLAGMRVGDEGFERMSRILVQLADQLCDGRLISFLEGGYNLEALGRCAALHVGALQETR